MGERWFPKKPNPMMRPKHVAIYDQHGDILRSVVIKADSLEVEDHTDDPLLKKRTPPPGFR